MNIELESLKIINFKGIKDLAIDFGKVTNISGENGLGKTTIQDAFTFLLFDKDSKDISKFDAQPLDKLNNPIHNLETVIEATLKVDCKELTLRRIYREKYTKVKGTSKLDFKGYESEYYVNEVPHKVTGYKKYISGLLDEDIFKLVTNPVYFSSLEKKKRMEIITEIVGDLDNIAVLDAKKELEPLRKHLTEYTVNELMKMVRSKVNKLKEDRVKLPVRIDEANKSIQEFEFEALDIQKRSVEGGIKSIEEQLQDKSKENEGLYSLKAELMKKKSELMELTCERDLNRNKPKEKLEGNIRACESDIRHLKKIIAEYEELTAEKQNRILNTLNIKRASLLETYKTTKELKFEFDEDGCVCPTCARKFETDDIEAKKTELEGNFNSSKAKKLEVNISEGKRNAAKIEQLKNEVNDLDMKAAAQLSTMAVKENLLIGLKKELSNIGSDQVEDPEAMISIKKEILVLEGKIKDFKVADTEELNFKKSELKTSLQEAERQLAFKETNEKTLKRIAELTEEELKLSEKIAELEGLEILSEEFIRTKVALLEEKVNSKFKYVSFKMFRNQVNGGLEECCEPCIDGVPFTSNLNTAARINAGLDIINTLCSHYGVNAPIFIDNKESVNKTIDVDSQAINLIVSKDKKLKVEVI